MQIEVIRNPETDICRVVPLPFPDAVRLLADENYLRENPIWTYPVKKITELDGSDETILIYDRPSGISLEHRLVKYPKVIKKEEEVRKYLAEYNEYNFFGKGSWEPIGTSFGMEEYQVIKYTLEAEEIFSLRD